MKKTKCREVVITEDEKISDDGDKTEAGDKLRTRLTSFA